MLCTSEGGSQSSPRPTYSIGGAEGAAGGVAGATDAEAAATAAAGVAGAAGVVDATGSGAAALGSAGGVSDAAAGTAAALAGDATTAGATGASGAIGFVEACLLACASHFVGRVAMSRGLEPAAASPANWALIVAASRSMVARGVILWPHSRRRVPLFQSIFTHVCLRRRAAASVCGLRHESEVTAMRNEAHCRERRASDVSIMPAMPQHLLVAKPAGTADDLLRAGRAFRGLETTCVCKPKQKRHASARRKRDGRWLPRTAL